MFSDDCVLVQAGWYAEKVHSCKSYRSFKVFLLDYPKSSQNNEHRQKVEKKHPSKKMVILVSL